jgi:hypothetical protein
VLRTEKERKQTSAAQLVLINGAKVRLDASHAFLASKPDEVTALIDEAASATTK